MANKNPPKQRLGTFETHSKYVWVLTPYIVLSSVSILLYLGLRWVLDIHLNKVTLSEEMWRLYIPTLFILAINLLMMPFINRLQIGKGSVSRFWYYFIIYLMLLMTVDKSQLFISQAAYEVINVADISEVNEYPNERFFRPNRFELDKSRSLFHASQTLTGKGNAILRTYLHIVTPFKEDQRVWFGFSDRYEVSNELTESEKKRKIIYFLNNKIEDYQDSEPDASVTVFERLPISFDYLKFVQAFEGETMINIDPYSNNRPIILIPSTRPDNTYRDLMLTILYYLLSIGLVSLMTFYAKFRDC